MEVSIPKKTLVALSESPEAFKKEQFEIKPVDEAKVSVFDRSFHFGDSIYEVARTYGGVIFALDRHMARMRHSMELAAFEEFPSFDFLKKMIEQTTARWFQEFGNGEVYVRWMVSRGLSDLNINRALSSSPYGFVFVKPLEIPSVAQFEKGLHFAIVSRLRNHPRAVDPHMKSGNYINNILAFSEAKKMGADDAILLDQNGFVTEGTTNNVFMVKDKKIKTSKSALGILDGITREFIFKAAEQLKIEWTEAEITAPEFEQADEVFMSSSIKEIMPITLLNGQKIGQGPGSPGEITVRLARKLKELILAETQKGKSWHVPG